jgi:murein DD-endopeptidase MepM/ murein hydrolase activator NlpD
VKELLKRNTVIIVVLFLLPIFPVQDGKSLNRAFYSTIEQAQKEDPSGYSDGQSGSRSGTWEYTTQSGDTLEIIASRFQVGLGDIDLRPRVPADQLIDPGQKVDIQRPRLDSPQVTYLLPDSEVVYSPSTVDFSTQDFVVDIDGFLSDHNEYLRSTGPTPAAEIIERVAVENSIHPRLLLALLEYQCGCVTGPLQEGVEPDNLMKLRDPLRRGLYRQLGWAVNQLSLGYYAWRQGILHELVLFDGSAIALPPDLNAGSAAVAYLFSQLVERDDWERAMGAGQSFVQVHQDLYADAWETGFNLGDLFPAGLSQPEMILPFEVDREWSLTSGPHPAWETEGATAALDFAPPSERFGCEPSVAWVLAAADGMVIRSEHNALVLDLDGDGHEGTGWALLYMHLANHQRTPAGTYLERGDPIGHPSCEGGPADGTHVHLARKFNGEWIAAGGPLPFVMSGWVAQAGYRPYVGSLTRGDRVIQANPLSPAAAFISRSFEDAQREARVTRDLWWEG